MNFNLQAVVAKPRLLSRIKVLDTFDVHPVPLLQLNTNWFVFSCSPGMIGMRYTWFMCTSDFLRSEV